MEVKGDGLKVTVDPAEQADDWLINAAAEIAEAAKERGLELPAFAGTTAVEAVQRQPVTPEEVEEWATEQLDSARRDYEATAELINKGRRGKNRFEVADPETISKEFTAWFSEDKKAYLKEAMEADPEQNFRLVMTPNEPVEAAEVIALAEQFGKGQPYSTDVYAEIYGKYNGAQLSGYVDDGTKMRFAFIPHKLNPDLTGTVPQQRQKLAAMQAEHPFLRVQTVLEDVAFVKALRQRAHLIDSKDLKGEGTADLTYSRHFDLPEQRLGGFDFVPYSIVYDYGRFILSDSWAGDDRDGRVAVG